jgi:4'-phosphopantetheinyl transferase
MRLEPKPTIKHENIDIWLAYYDDIVSEQLLSTMRVMLTEEERQQEMRFCFPTDRKRYLVTRATVRSVLSLYADVPPSAWRFSTNEFGKPAIANMRDDVSGLRFNISHTKGLIALGIAQHREIGIDVEKLNKHNVSIDLANHLFASNEIIELQNVRPEQFVELFFEYWTFKESYIKARGIGLSLALDKFSFHFPHERAVQITINPELNDDETRWHFRQYRPTGEYFLALCGERAGNDEPVVTIRKIIPTIEYELFDSPLLKSSETSTLRGTEVPALSTLT